MRHSIAAVTLTLALVACGTGDDGDPMADVATTGEPTTEHSSASDPPVTETPATAAAAASDPPATEPPAIAPTTTEPAAATYAEGAGIATIELRPTRAGEQPILAWAPVEGAASYRLVALTSDGSPYWAWSGEETEVRFGGAPDTGGQTAVVFEPMTWRVIALDADGVPIAASEPGELTP